MAGTVGSFSSNITHREVATREELQEVSTTSHQSSNQGMWGGDTGLWIAIQELAKLAMVSTTLVTGQNFLHFLLRQPSLLDFSDS